MRMLPPFSLRLLSMIAMLMIGAGASRGAAQPAPVILPNLEPRRVPATPMDTLWMVGGSQDAGGISLGGVMAVVADSNGRILIVDYTSQVIHVVDQSGRLIGTMGRAGEGPGEFRTPYRAAVAPDGLIYVFDLFQGRLSEFGRDLRFIRSLPLQPMLTPQHLLVTDSSILISGVDRSGSNVGVIHEFRRRDGALVRSLGHLLPARAPHLVTMMGTGPHTLDPLGRVWYVTPGPYRIEAYSPTGAMLLNAVRTNRFLPPLEDAFIITATEGRVRTSVKPHPVVLAVWFSRADRMFVAMMTADREQIVDEFRVGGPPDGPTIALVGSTRAPLPLLGPWGEVRPEHFAVGSLDKDQASVVSFVRRRARP